VIDERRIRMSRGVGYWIRLGTIIAVFAAGAAVFRDRTDADYQALLAGLREGKSLLDSEPRYGTPHFQPNPQYVREMRKYGMLPTPFNPTNNRLDVLDTDQRYWESFWYQPAANTAVK
jgi:hypothetical protein